ncbi:hypothetical protein QR680_018084 [Steinernema hermaphroditum]|uniref:Uncharacterized protein n=1 Tax=Steinernema hermaphroditum TaxID=289476 RepID=A0AA39HJ27_9BILA|nr:hypothetical protein QR680_018084 [Steinernema hermaphroditum]
MLANRKRPGGSPDSGQYSDSNSEDDDGWVKEVSSKDIAVADVIHKDLRFPWPLPLLLSNRWFQRLRKIKTVGVAQKVFRDAKDDLFCLSMGRYHITNEFLGHILSVYPNRISNQERFCVGLAALCLDLGAAPDEYLRIRDALKNTYMYNTVDTQKEDFERYVSLVKALISGAPALTVVEAEKAFLFDIVQNPKSLFDLDTVERLLRTSRFCRTPIDLDSAMFKKLINVGGSPKLFVEEDGPHEGLTRFSIRKESSYLESFLENAIHKINKTITYHKTVVAIREMCIEALEHASDCPLVPGFDVSLGDIHHDLEAFYYLNDSVYELISECDSPSARLKHAKGLISRIERDLWKQAINEAIPSNRVLSTEMATETVIRLSGYALDKEDFHIASYNIMPKNRAETLRLYYKDSMVPPSTISTRNNHFYNIYCKRQDRKKKELIVQAFKEFEMENLNSPEKPVARPSRGVPEGSKAKRNLMKEEDF